MSLNRQAVRDALAYCFGDSQNDKQVWQVVANAFDDAWPDPAAAAGASSAAVEVLRANSLTTFRDYLEGVVFNAAGGNMPIDEQVERINDLVALYETALSAPSRVSQEEPCADGHVWSNQFGDDWTPERGAKCDCGKKDWGERVQEIRQHAPEFDNHHNALMCPYCNPKKLVLSQPSAAEFWRCRTCGCFWRDNHDDTVSLANKHEKSCTECEWNPTAVTCEPLYLAAQPSAGPVAASSREGGEVCPTCGDATRCGDTFHNNDAWSCFACGSTAWTWLSRLRNRCSECARDGAAEPIEMASPVAASSLLTTIEMLPRYAESDGSRYEHGGFIRRKEVLAALRGPKSENADDAPSRVDGVPVLESSLGSTAASNEVK